MKVKLFNDDGTRNPEPATMPDQNTDQPSVSNNFDVRPAGHIPLVKWENGIPHYRNTGGGYTPFKGYS